ncbi:hypothetical protein QR680_016108 [Steinernema hermaphroditum]|uniref:Uncharacterized protein n=1 Tax=Steinernema hermaphroditum TaxID=289476 RepID=A0AA39HA29_9BILA|nr:hypothetical protein QR680_016108 [Steinernema hermaphroditum]
MYAALAFVLFVISSAHAQDAYSIANYAYNNVSNFLQVNEFVAVVQYCPSGTSAVMAAASKYATDQQVQIFFDAVYQAVNGVNPNDWSIIRNDAAGAADFAKFGY